MNDFRSITKKVLEDHEIIIDSLVAMRQLLQNMDSTGTGVPQALAVADMLGDKLDSHFRGEENSGLFTVLKKLLPEEAPAMDRLVNDHGGLRIAMNMIREELDSPGPNKQQIFRIFSSFAKVLEHHEAEEDRLILIALARKEELSSQEQDLPTVVTPSPRQETS